MTLVSHHILPYESLRDTWNGVITTFVQTNLPDARVALRQFVKLADFRAEMLESTLDEIRGGRLSVYQCNALTERIAWAPWNIVEGPQRRSDDPQLSSYKLDRFVFGLNGEEKERFPAIEGLYRAFEYFNRDNRASMAALSSLKNEISVARSRLAFAHQRIPFRREMWEQLQDGRWRKARRSADAN